MNLEGKVAIVTGAAQGIGQGITLKLAERGAKVVVSDIAEDVKEVVKEIEESGQQAISLLADVTDPEQVEKMVQSALDKWGQLDILVNNAGIYPYKSLMAMDESDWDKVIDINLKGVFNSTKAALPALKKDGGSIINMASIAGTVVGYRDLAHYSASKAGVLGFTRAAALELAPNKIRVNAIAPGAIQTPTVDKTLTKELREKTIASIPWQRMGTPEDIANVVAFLASDESEYITGQLLIVDGGLTVQ
ncbi:MAG: SDR family NAD(P)-dependent oxidoreductase [Candidatus Thorarchaeota archaeon]